MTTPTDPPTRPVCFVLSEPPTHDAPHHAMAAIWLARRGFPVEVVCLGRDDRPVIATPLADLPTHWVPPGRNRAASVARLAGALWAWRRRRDGDRPVYYVNGSQNCPSALAALAGVPAGRVVYHTQDFLEPGRHPHYEFFERRFARRAGHVICNEPNRARVFASVYGLARVPHVVPTALPRDWPLPAFDPAARAELVAGFPRPVPADRAVLVISQGAFSPLRCTAGVIAALARLPDHVRLVITGARPDSPARAEAADHARRAGVADRVLQLPHLSYDRMLAYTAACDAGVLLYVNDGIGNYYQMPGRLSSYLGVGLPFVTSDFPGLAALCARYDVGEPCDPTDPAAIAAALARVADRPWEDRRRRSDRLRRTFADALAYDHHAAVVEGVVRAAMGG